MNRLLSIAMTMCIFAFPVLAQPSCETIPDRWGIREPTQAEADEHGSSIIVFEYYNSEMGCSEATEGIGIWFKGTRIGTMIIHTHGPALMQMEEVDFIVDPESGYEALDSTNLWMMDGEEPKTIILYPLMF